MRENGADATFHSNGSAKNALYFLPLKDLFCEIKNNL